MDRETDVAVDGSGILVASRMSSELVVAAQQQGGWQLEQVTARWTRAPALAAASDGPYVSYFGGSIEGESGSVIAIYRPIDGIDQTCDGIDGVDADHDGHASSATGGDDPDDADPARRRPDLMGGG